MTAALSWRRQQLPCCTAKSGALAGVHLGAVEVHVMLEALDLVLRQALVEGQQHLHLVAALEARPRQARHHVPQATHLQRGIWAGSWPILPSGATWRQSYCYRFCTRLHIDEPVD